MLACHCVPILESGKAHRHLRNSSESGQSARDPFGIGTALLDAQQIVLSLAIGVEAQGFLHDEVLGRALEYAAQHRSAVGMGQDHEP